MSTKVKCRSNQCLRYGNFESGICPKCIGLINKAYKVNSKPLKKQSDRSYPKAFKNAKAAFQLLRRVQESDNNGLVKCVHGKRCHYTKCDGGHFYPAIYKNTCFNALNVWPQEKIKNMDMMNPETVNQYKEFLIEKIGVEQFTLLTSCYKLPKKYSTFELIEMTNFYNSEIERIKKDKGI
jgi:hypothetical protein